MGRANMGTQEVQAPHGQLLVYPSHARVSLLQNGKGPRMIEMKIIGVCLAVLLVLCVVFYGLFACLVGYISKQPSPCDCDECKARRKDAIR
jgi:hypothetical protein